MAAVATLGYAAASLMLLQLVSAIFGEVLRYDGGGLPREAAALVALRTVARAREPGRPEAPAPAPSPPAGQARVFLDRILNDGYLWTKPPLGIDERNVIYFAPLLFVLVFVLRSGSDFLNGYTFQHIGLGATNDLRNDLYRRTLEQTSRFHAEHPSGELVSRIVNDVSVLQSAISTRLVDLVQQSVTLVALLLLLFSIHFRLALFCVVAAPPVLYPIVRFSKGMRKHQPSHPGAHRRPRQPGLGGLPRASRGQGLRHGGLREGALPGGDAAPPARQPAGPAAVNLSVR